MRRLCGIALVALVVIVASSAQAGTDRSAACPAPKPLPAGVKKPPKGANATQLANFLLTLPQRKPCDVSLFTSEFQPGPWPGLYPEGRPMQALGRMTPTEAQVRAQLAAFLGRSTGKAAALALFDRADVKTKMPDPTLRAALVGLRGTVAESVIDFFLTSTYAAPPRFGGLPVGQVGRASVVGYPQRTIQIIVNVRYQPEHFALLSGVLAHEILHHDETPNYPEEIILNALTATVHMQLLNRRPELGTGGTELSRYMNEWILQLANSRAPGSSRISVVVPKGHGVTPGSPKDAPDFWTFYTKAYTGQIRGGTPDVLPAPPVLAAVFGKLLVPGVALPKPLTYSKKTAQLFSKMNDSWLSPVDRLRVSMLLGLVSMEEIVKYAGLSRGKAIATFKLAPILAVK